MRSEAENPAFLPAFILPADPRLDKFIVVIRTKVATSITDAARSPVHVTGGCFQCDKVYVLAWQVTAERQFFQRMALQAGLGTEAISELFMWECGAVGGFGRIVRVR